MIAKDLNPSGAPRRYLPLLLVLFACSGCSALIYEIVWYQLLQLVIGSTAVSLGVGRGNPYMRPTNSRNSAPLRRSKSSDSSGTSPMRSEEHTSELQSLRHLVCRLLLEKKKKK